MELLFIAIIKALVLPPGLIFLGLFIGLRIRKRKARFGKVIVSLSAVAGLLFSMPIVSGSLALWAESYSPIPPADISSLRADAIVILAGGKDDNRTEYGGVTISKVTLQRLRYGAKLARALNLPILVSGGVVHGEGVGEARYMAKALEEDFGLTPRWIEDRSRNTAQNASLSRQMLNTDEIILVTHALHMRRARAAFVEQGMKVIPAPVASVAHGKPLRVSLFSFLPSEKAILISHDALHELLGSLWYAWRY